MLDLYQTQQPAEEPRTRPGWFRRLILALLNLLALFSFAFLSDEYGRLADLAWVLAGAACLAEGVLTIKGRPATRWRRGLAYSLIAAGLFCLVVAPLLRRL